VATILIIFPENQLTNGSMGTLGMIYHDRGGDGLGSDEGRVI